MEQVKDLSLVANDVAESVKDGLRNMWASLETCGQNCKDAAMAVVEELSSGVQKKRQQTSKFMSLRKKSQPMVPSNGNMFKMKRPVSDSALNIHGINSVDISTFNDEMFKTSEHLSNLLKMNMYTEESFQMKKQLLHGVRSRSIVMNSSQGNTCPNSVDSRRRNLAKYRNDVSANGTFLTDELFTNGYDERSHHKRKISCNSIRRDKRRHISANSINSDGNSSTSSGGYWHDVDQKTDDDVCLTPFEACPLETKFEPSYWIGLSLRKDHRNGRLRLVVRQTGVMPAVAEKKNFSKLKLNLTARGNKHSKKFDIALIKSKSDGSFSSHTLYLDGMENECSVTLDCKLTLFKRFLRTTPIVEWQVVSNVSSKEMLQHHWKQLKGSTHDD